VKRVKIKKYFYNFNWLVIDKIIRVFGGLFIGVWVARYLGPIDFGILNYSLAFVAFFSFLSTLGLNSIVIKEVLKHEKLFEQIMGVTFYLKLLGGVFALILGSLFLFLLNPEQNEIKMIITILLFGYIFQSIDTIDYALQSQIMSKYVVFSRSIAFIFSSILKIYFIMNEYSLIYFAITIVLEMIVASFFLVTFYKKLGFAIRKWKFNLRIAMKLLKSSWPLMLSGFFIIIYMKIDQVMIESFLGMKEVGLYSVAVRLSEAWYFIPAAIISTLFPYFINLKDLDESLYIYRIRQLITFMFWLGTLVGFMGMMFGEEAILFLYGEVYKGAYLALAINIWAGIFISIGMVLTGIWMITYNLQIYSLIGTLIGVILNIVGNYYLIPQYGIEGAAFSTLVTQGFGLWITPLFFKKIRIMTVVSLFSIIPVYILRKSK